MNRLRINGQSVEPERLLFEEFTKKPVTIHAVRVFLDFQVETLEGTMSGNAGDWLIQGVEGELYPCKPNVFDKTYEKRLRVTREFP